MADQTHEQTINVALGEILARMGRTWNVRTERIGDVFTDGGRADLLIEEPGGWPMALEAEVGNHAQAEKEALSRLGKQLVGTMRTVESAVAIVYPKSLRQYDGDALRQALQETELEYALLVRELCGSAKRSPAFGWLRGKVDDLAMLAHQIGVGESHVWALADALQVGVTRAAGSLTSEFPIGSHPGKRIAEALGQHDDDEGQTRKMAMAVITNALVFHAALARAGLIVEDLPTKESRPAKAPEDCRSFGNFLKSVLLDEWDAILNVNYWPIFYVARQVVAAIPTYPASVILGGLWKTAEDLLSGGVAKSHDLTGVVFQRLIADRKFLATFYTRPAAASLLAGLAMPLHRPLAGVDWGEQKSMGELRIGDFACGTGTLLSTAYGRICALHEVCGGDPRQLHPTMMRRGLVGLDVLNVAVHLTAAMLAGVYPDTPFEGECLLTMPYGNRPCGPSVGSLELLNPETPLPFAQEAARTAGGTGERVVHDFVNRVRHESFALVIMNPPFTRHGAREGDRVEVHNPAFAAFEATEDEQNVLAEHLKAINGRGCAHGHAGLASYFVDLAHLKASRSGTVALVLPLTAMSGQSWEKVRVRWRNEYSDIRVATISQRGTHTRSFSADTGMAECLVVARKVKPPEQERRGFFIVLGAQPRSNLDGYLIAQAVTSLIDAGQVRRLEDGPLGGTRVAVGDETVGELVDCALPSEGAWPMVGVSDISLGQTAFRLAEGELWIEGMHPAKARRIPLVPMGEACKGMGPHHLDITGALVKADKLPQGPFERLTGAPSGAAYPCLWSHNNKSERRLLVSPDSHLQVRHVREDLLSRLLERAATRWATATRVHYNLDLQFNSQSLVVATTERLCMGGRAWPSVILDNREHEYAFALWCNSSLGLLCHWWMANKSQDGRGCTTVSSVSRIPTLDVGSLTPEQHAAAMLAFESLSQERFLPFDQIDEDRARAELDRRLLVDVLGFDPELCEPGGPMDLLRRKLATEPQITGRKTSRVRFTATGEETVARSQQPGA